MTTNSLRIWSQTKAGLLFWTAVFWLVAYITASLAIDTGSYWYYAAAVIDIVLGIRTGLSLFKK